MDQHANGEKYVIWSKHGPFYAKFLVRKKENVFDYIIKKTLIYAHFHLHSLYHQWGALWSHKTVILLIQSMTFNPIK